jgi:hypothetical protein
MESGAMSCIATFAVFEQHEHVIVATGNLGGERVE